jgi:simple sugar transport system permease protein
MSGRARVALVLVVVALALGPLFLTPVPPSEWVPELWGSSFGEPRGWALTLRELTPLLIGGVAVWLALRAGLFNIGAEGQMLVGACATGVVALVPAFPGQLVFAIGAGVLAGALWALPAGALRTFRGGHEVISCIMLNQLAFLFTGWLVKGPMKDPNAGGATTKMLDESLRWAPIAKFGRAELDWALPLGLALMVGLWYWRKHRVGGYELEAVGTNATAARFAGIPAEMVQFRAFAMSGGLAGLAGALLVVADQNRFYDGMTSGKGFDSLGVALLAGANPLALAPSALLFAALNAATTGMNQIGIPKGLSGLMLGGLILLFASASQRKDNAHE